MRRAIKTLGKRVNELQQLLDTSRDELSKESEESDRIIFINSDIENTKQEIEELQEAIKQLLK